LEYWSIAKYDLGLTENEFWKLTPEMFKALRKRQEVEFRKQCFVSAIVAADYRNAHRTESSQQVWSPLDYVSCEEDGVNDEREQAKMNAKNVYLMMGSLTPEQAASQKAKTIDGFIKAGFEDAEQMFEEMFGD
jgi:hypothetical protein